ncbi:MAG: Crp/Fnr family transcriptional regulator [Planctomycetaceae bacterium]|nr:Crp/Fnr family transcriptional regulator [Planctomycetaceae bacterium]
MDNELISVLKATAMFSALDEQAVEAFAHQCRVQKVHKGQMFFSPGQPADRFFAVLEGRVKIFIVSPRGDEQTLHLYGPGSTFGEAAMLRGGDFPAYAEATTDSRVLVISRQSLRAALTRNADLALGMMAGLSAKLHEFNRLIEELSLKEVPARLAGVLLRQARAAGKKTFKLAHTKRELAAQIGTVSETLSRALAKLKSLKLIAVKGSQITVLDLHGLEALASAG